MRRVWFVVLVVLLLSTGVSTAVSGAKPTESRVYLLVFRDELDPERVAGSLQRQHGFELAAIRSFGRVVPDEHFARLAGINADRFAKIGEGQA